MKIVSPSGQCLFEIRSDGNVGLNTINPSAKLHVFSNKMKHHKRMASIEKIISNVY
jgi:hypothetical protein